MPILRLREIAALYKPRVPQTDLVRTFGFGATTLTRLFSSAEERFAVGKGPGLGTLQHLAEYYGVDVAALIVSPERIPNVVRDVLLYEHPDAKAKILTQLKAVIAELEDKPIDRPPPPRVERRGRPRGKRAVDKEEKREDVSAPPRVERRGRSSKDTSTERSS